MMPNRTANSKHLLQWPQKGPVSLICDRKWHETPDCISFTLISEPQQSLFHFIPGQFVTLAIEIEGVTEYRAYSISSMPNQPQLQLTVKRVKGGKVSNYLHDQLQVGDSVAVMPPAGQFHLQQPKGKRLLLLSAGCGITPVMSMARTLLADTQDQTDIHFIHAATCAEHIIYHQELKQMADGHARFKLNIMLEDANQTEYVSGRLTQADLTRYSPDIHTRSVFLCGPVEFMRAMERHLQALNVDMTHFYHESFTPEQSFQALQHEPEEHASALAKATVYVPDFAAQVQVSTGSVLLDALERANVPVIAACRSGICGSCKCKVTKGEYTRTSTQTLTEQELADGYVLACSCQIHSDTEVTLP